MSTTEMPLERVVLKEAARSLLAVAIELNDTSDIQLQSRVLGALPDQVLPELLGVEAQHPPGVAHLGPAIAGDVGIRHLHPLGPAGFPGACANVG